MVKIILIFFIVLFISLLQISFISSFENLRSLVNLVLVFLIIFIWFTSWQKTLPWILLAGLILEFYSVLNFGLILLTLTLSVGAAWLFQRKLFRHKSFISLVLILIIGVICYYFLLLSFSLLLYSVGLTDYSLWKNINNWIYIFIGSPMINAALGLLLTIIIKIIINTMGKSFLISNHKYDL